jgi:hypothetical protein
VWQGLRTWGVDASDGGCRGGDSNSEDGDNSGSNGGPMANVVHEGNGSCNEAYRTNRAVMAAQTVRMAMAIARKSHKTEVRGGEQSPPQLLRCGAPSQSTFWAEYLKVLEERRLVEEQVTEQEGRLLRQLWPGYACGSSTWQLEQYRPVKATEDRRRCDCPAVQRSGEYQHRLKPAGSAEQVKGKEVLSGCIAIGCGWTLAHTLP